MLGWIAMLALAGALGSGTRARGASDWQWTKGQGWTKGLGKPKDTPAGQLRHAYALEKKIEFMDACRQYFLLVKSYPESEEAGVGLQRLSYCLFKMENFYQSFKALEQVLADYPIGVNKSKLVVLEYRLGQEFLRNGARVDLLNRHEKREDAVAAAIEIYKAVLKHDPFGPYAAPALLALGDGHRELKEFEKAKGFYNRILNDFPHADKIVDNARLGIAECNVLLGDGDEVAIEQTIEDIAVRRAEEGRDATPAEKEELEEISGRLDNINEMRAKKMWDAYEFYKQRGTRNSIKAAKFTLEQIVERYPRTSYAKLARKELGIIEVPSDKLAFIERIQLPNPFKKRKKSPVQTPSRGEDKVEAKPVKGYIPGADHTPQGAGGAGVRPAAPHASMPETAPAAPEAAPAPVGPSAVPAGANGTDTTAMPPRDPDEPEYLKRAEHLKGADELGPLPETAPAPRPASTRPFADGAAAVPGPRQPAPRRPRQTEKPAAPLPNLETPTQPASSSSKTKDGWTFSEDF